MQQKISIKRLGMVFGGILFFQTSFSQENYLPGYVINLKRDTVSGFIDYRNWEKNPDQIHFRDKIINKPITLKPTDITEFRVLDEIYLSGIVESEISQSKNDLLATDDPDLHIKVDTTFLETLFIGKKSLYYYNTSYGKENFYIKQGDEYQLLLHKKYLKTKEQKNVIIDNKKYIEQLAIYLADRPSIQSRINNTLYNKKSLSNLFQDYYSISKSDLVFQKKIEKISTEIGILAGASLSSLEFKSDDFTFLVKSKYSQSTNFTTGLFFNLILPRNQRKWSIINELQYTQYKVNGEYKEIENENIYTLTKTEIGLSYLTLNNMIRYKYPIGKVSIYLNGGISNGFSIDQINTKIKTTRFYTTENTESGNALRSTRKYAQGFLAGTGLNYNKFSFEIRFELGNGMSEFTALNSTTKKYFFLFGYSF